MDIISQFRMTARDKKKKIVFPEGEEERVVKAASFLEKENLVRPILLGDAKNINDIAKVNQLNISGIEIINPVNSVYLNAWSNVYYEMRKHKNVTKEQAEKIVKLPLFFGAFMLKENIADGAVAGSINTTGDVLRAGIQIVGLAQSVDIVSSSFLMVFKDGSILTFADCAVIPDPDENQLASIAISSARTHERLAGTDPKIAMLSFSTKGSAQHPHVQKVVNATELVKQKSPNLKIDGELQFDSAYVENIGRRKAPGSEVAGHANVYIFPDLDAGNIGYKITQRLAGAEAIGPIIQGLQKPYNDLSRGCSVDDIINVACICAILA
jgi:phosphate acetyltransferase